MLMIAVPSYEKGCKEIDDWLDRHRASFETAASQLHQDEEFSKCYQRLP
jgi:hypothetical protein